MTLIPLSSNVRLIMQKSCQKLITRHSTRGSGGMSLRRRNAKSRNRIGAALVEFAIVSPLMILFTLGMIEIGRMTMVKQLLVNVSREGAREGTLPGTTNESVKTSVQSLLASSYINGATVVVTSGSIPASSRDDWRSLPARCTCCIQTSPDRSMTPAYYAR